VNRDERLYRVHKLLIELPLASTWALAIRKSGFSLRMSGIPGTIAIGSKPGGGGPA